MYIQPCRFKYLYINDPWTSLLDNVLTTIKVLMNIFETYADTVSHSYRRSGFSLVNELEKRGSNHDMISHFFKNTECISLECDRNCNRLIDHNPSHLFNAALSSDNPKLSKLSIDCKKHSFHSGNYTSVSQQINYISPFLSPTIVPHSVLPKCTPYDNLQELCIAELCENITFIKEQGLISNESPLYQIAGIINHQKRLKCVKLAGRLHTLPNSEALITSLIDFMARPSFEEIHIRSDLNTDSAVMLLIVFLTVPATHEQRLVLSNVNCVGKCEKCSKLLSNLSTSPNISQQIKILQLHKVVFKQDMISIISKIPPVCLKVLKICNLEPILPPNISTCELIIDQLFSFMSLGEQLRHFLMNANIRTLHICFSKYDYTRMNAYESLGHVLCDHAKHVKTINHIKCSRPTLGILDYSSSSFVAFLNCLIEFAQLVDLELTFLNLSSELCLLHSVWRDGKNSRKFRRININIPEQDLLSPVHEMCGELVIL